MNRFNQNRLRRFFNATMAEVRSTSQELRSEAQRQEQDGFKEAEEVLVKSAVEWDAFADRLEASLTAELKREGVL